MSSLLLRLGRAGVERLGTFASAGRRKPCVGRTENSPDEGNEEPRPGGFRVRGSVLRRVKRSADLGPGYGNRQLNSMADREGFQVR